MVKAGICSESLFIAIENQWSRREFGSPLSGQLVELDAPHPDHPSLLSLDYNRGPRLSPYLQFSLSSSSGRLVAAARFRGPSGTPALSYTDVATEDYVYAPNLLECNLYVTLTHRSTLGLL